MGSILVSHHWLGESKHKSSTARDHLLLCNHSPSFESFSVLTKTNRKSKESLPIMRDKLSLNTIISSIIPIQQEIVKVDFSFAEFNSGILLIRF